MARLSFTNAADDDLFDIGRYITEESGDRAITDAFLLKIYEKCARLAALPGALGQARPELRADMRSTPFQGYVIFFHYTGDTLEIVNVLQAHRNIDGYFNS